MGKIFEERIRWYFKALMFDIKVKLLHLLFRCKIDLGGFYAFKKTKFVVSYTYMRYKIDSLTISNKIVLNLKLS